MIHCALQPDPLSNGVCSLSPKHPVRNFSSPHLINLMEISRSILPKPSHQNVYPVESNSSNIYLIFLCQTHAPFKGTVAQVLWEQRPSQRSQPSRACCLLPAVTGPPQAKNAVSGLKQSLTYSEYIQTAVASQRSVNFSSFFCPIFHSEAQHKGLGSP